MLLSSFARPIAYLIEYQIAVESPSISVFTVNSQISTPWVLVLKKLNHKTPTPAIPLRKSTSVLPLLKIPKNRMNMLIIRRTLGTVAIPKQCTDMLTGVDIAPARRALVGPVLERLPAAALPWLIEADGARVVVAGVERGIVGGAEDVLAQRVEAVERVGDWGCEGYAVAELEHCSSNAFL